MPNKLHIFSLQLELFLDERQITHLICAPLKYDLYDFFRGCFWGLVYKRKSRKQAQNTPKKVV